MRDHVHALVFLLDGGLSHNAFADLLYTTIVILSFLHVALLRMNKMVGRWYHVITAYMLILTVVYADILWADWPSDTAQDRGLCRGIIPL